MIERCLIAVLVWVASVVGSYFYGLHNGQAIEQAKQAAVKSAMEETREAAKQGAADAIAKIVVRNTTVQGRVETIVRDNPVYRDCKHDDASLQLINQALTGSSGTGRNGSGSVSRTDTTN